MNGEYWQPEIETMPREKLRELQAEKLRRTIGIALKSPFYGSKLRESGVTPDDIKTVDDIRKLPFTTKQDLRDNYPFGLVGGDMKEYARVDVLGLMPQILKKSFVLLLDDLERPGEQHTARTMKETLDAHGIAYAKGVYSGLKKTLILCSTDNHFFTSL